METAPLNMALVCLASISVPNPQNMLPISAEPSLSTKSTILPSDSSPEKITASRILQKISLLLKNLENTQLKNCNTPYH